MDVAIAGGHGQIALRLERLLSAGGHRTRAIIRNPDHAGDVTAAGAEPVVLDLEALAGVAALADAARGADAVVFAAGAGPGSGPER
ncbi:MAG TPA: NAD(P)H-binding protein, partial [Acidimicrobiales bacterium]